MSGDSDARHSPVVDPQLVSVRDLSEEDIDQVTKYWYHSPPGFIEAIGIDPKKLLPEPDFANRLIEECKAKQTSRSIEVERPHNHLQRKSYRKSHDCSPRRGRSWDFSRTYLEI